jgi:peptidoglycan hydrolase-like protein with peptidoglycan-binding domain
MKAFERVARSGAGSALAGVLFLAGLSAVPGPVFAQLSDQPAVADDASTYDLDLIGSEVRQVQQALRERGYFVGPADGRKEERLRTALRDFQRAEGLPVTGGLDKGTLVKLGLALPDEAEIIVAGVQPELPSEPQPETMAVVEPRGEVVAESAPVEPAAPSHEQAKPRKDRRDLVSFGKVGVTRTGRALATAGTSVADAGKTTGEAIGTGGKAVGKAGAKAGVATADAAKTSAHATKVGALAVANAPKALYSTGRRAIFGKSGDRASQDEKIRASLEARYSEDSRIIPEEVEIRVSEGHVTLVFPQYPRTDVAYAARLAKLTAGVVSVEAEYR